MLAMIMAVPVMANSGSSQSMSSNASMGTTGTAGNMSTNASMGTTGAAGQNVTIGLTAQGMAFNTSTITVPAGATVTMNFNNMDSGVPHNFAAYTDSSASKSIFVGQIINGPKTTTYTFTAPSAPGTYFFRCDVHPTTMTGQFIVK
ncbi:MAG TPA: cupredoxin domain-containing protein [Methanotrichaceae archaeon]|nr:cupredoxin domain-containing protein [Methanotrichaceae archaeon]